MLASPEGSYAQFFPPIQWIEIFATPTAIDAPAGAHKIEGHD